MLRIPENLTPHFVRDRNHGIAAWCHAFKLPINIRPYSRDKSDSAQSERPAQSDESLKHIVFRY